MVNKVVVYKDVTIFAQMQVNKSIFLYLPSLSFGIIVLLSFDLQGLYSFLPIIISFGIIPIIELFLKPGTSISNKNHSKWYKIPLYFIVPYQYFILIIFLRTMQDSLLWYEYLGAILSMGLLCGIYGINVAHELGHKQNQWDRFMAKVLLLSSLYMHFFIEHNRGHHKKVATPTDPASAKKNQSVYHFWYRSVVYSYISSFNLEKDRLLRNKQAVWSWRNEHLQYMIIEISFVIMIYFFFGLIPMLGFIAASMTGILLLESINYIEHYGLYRKEISDGVYERVSAKHSWNSDHIIGRYFLFELPRHPDHHLNSLKEYQSLASNQEAPQMPTGYPGMIVLAMVPPLWFGVMNKRLSTD